jgi:protein-L-isoaspartate(D-aspartate) O-methyltransferase
MTELCELSGNEKVLEIGTGSGYQAAVLSMLAKSVYTIEIVEELGKSASKRLNDLGYKNVKVKVGDGYKGWPEEAPFDVIILTACPPELPGALFAQLKEGGLIVAPVGDLSQELVKVEKVNGRMIKETITYVRFVPMVHSSERQ